MRHFEPLDTAHNPPVKQSPPLNNESNVCMTAIHVAAAAAAAALISVY